VHLSIASLLCNGLPRISGGSASALYLSRPAQTSLALRPAGSLNRPRRPLSRGSEPGSYPPNPLVSYQNKSTTFWAESPSASVTRLRGAPRCLYWRACRFVVVRTLNIRTSVYSFHKSIVCLPQRSVSDPTSMEHAVNSFVAVHHGQPMATQFDQEASRPPGIRAVHKTSRSHPDRYRDPKLYFACNLALLSCVIRDYGQSVAPYHNRLP